MNAVRSFKVKEIVPGRATGPALVTRERVSFHGFIDAARGVFTSPATELRGSSFAGRVMVFTSGKGAAAGPRVLDAACRNGHAPAGIVNLELEAFIVQACVMQDIPLVQVEDPSIFEAIRTGDIVTVDSARGEVTLVSVCPRQEPPRLSF